MTKEETTKIVLRLHGAYFSTDRIYNSSELDHRIGIWEIYFKDFTYRTVSQAVDEWIKANKVMPQIAELLPRCKDLRALEQGSLTDVENLRPTWELIWEARHGELKDEDISPEIRKMSDEFVKWLRADPKLKAQWKKEQKNNPTQSEAMGDCLPYEI